LIAHSTAFDIVIFKKGSRFRVQGSGFKVQGSGFKVQRYRSSPLARRYWMLDIRPSKSIIQYQVSSIQEPVSIIQYIGFTV
jgi:hypothetical protein